MSKSGWSLSEFSDAVKRMGDYNERQQKAYLKKARKQLPERIQQLPMLDIDELLNRFISFSGGRSDPRETVIMNKYAKAIRAEIIARTKR